jgi:hypothetical protein
MTDKNELLFDLKSKKVSSDGKAYPHDHNPDSCAQGDDIIYGHLAIVSLHDAGPDQVAPMGPDCSSTK